MGGNVASPGTPGDDISPWEWGNFGADYAWTVRKHISPDNVTTAATWTAVPDTTVNFYTAGGPLNIASQSEGYSTTQYYAYETGIALNSVVLEETSGGNSSTQVNKANDGGASIYTSYLTPELRQGSHSAAIYWRQQNGYTAHFQKGALNIREDR
jgi:hypothetical protein